MKIGDERIDYRFKPVPAPGLSKAQLNKLDLANIDKSRTLESRPALEDGTKWYPSGELRARLLGLRMLPGGVYLPWKLWLFWAWQGHCAYCMKVDVASFELEHMTPLSRGGLDDLTNLALACHICNSSKAARTVREFCSGGDTERIEYCAYLIARDIPKEGDMPDWLGGYVKITSAGTARMYFPKY